MSRKSEKYTSIFIFILAALILGWLFVNFNSICEQYYNVKQESSSQAELRHEYEQNNYQNE